MKKWYEEEYEFTIRVRQDFYAVIIRNTTVEMEKRSETDTPVPMDARSMNRAMGCCSKIMPLYLRICRQCEAVVTLQMSAERTSM